MTTCFQYYADEFFTGRHERGDETKKWMSTEFRGKVSAEGALAEVPFERGIEQGRPDRGGSDGF